MLELRTGRTFNVILDFLHVKLKKTVKKIVTLEKSFDLLQIIGQNLLLNRKV